MFANKGSLEESIVCQQEDVAYEELVKVAIAEGVSDMEAGRYVNSRQEMFEKAAIRRAPCA